MTPDDHDHYVALMGFIAEQTRSTPNHYVDIQTIRSRFRPGERLYRNLGTLETAKYISLCLHDDDILGVWGRDRLYERVDNNPRKYWEVKDYTDW